MTTRPNLPTGIGYLELLDGLEAATYRESLANLEDFETDRRLIGTALSALYQAATCGRKCHGGPHIFEALCARLYNLGESAYLLSLRGLYDEALNLTRSIGEISNLIALSMVDKDAISRWLSSDKKTRLHEFGPAKIRSMLKRQAPDLLLADDDWYSRFCEAYTHVTPQTKVNVHNPGGLAFAGGIYQEEGLRSTLGELASLLASVAMISCKYAQLNDLLVELCSLADLAQAEAELADGH